MVTYQRKCRDQPVRKPYMMREAWSVLKLMGWVINIGEHYKFDMFVS
ncbi:unnamed protein product [Camellia sinensis]